MVLELILGWDWRVRRLRKRWDRTREKSLKAKEPLRGQLLQKLDSIETNLDVLEEQNLGLIAGGNVANDIDAKLNELRDLLRNEAKKRLREIEASGA